MIPFGNLATTNGPPNALRIVISEYYADYSWDPRKQLLLLVGSLSEKNKNGNRLF